MKKKKLIDQVQIPDFPALASCLLIDSSHRSRLSLLKDIKSCGLFEEIIEAKSIEDGKFIIQSRDLDACLFGPAVSKNLIESFLLQIKDKLRSSDCAFIAAIKENSEIREIQDIHSIFVTPSTKLAFFEGIVRGILLANKNSPWPGVKLGEDGAVMFLEGEVWKRLEPLLGKQETSVMLLPDDFELSGNPASIKLFCDGLSTAPKSQIERIIRRLLANSTCVNDPFVKYFTEAIKEWRDDQSFLTLKEVSLNLRERLLRFEDDPVFKL